GVRSVRLPTPDCRSPVRRNALEFGLRALDCVARGQANNALCLGQHLPGIDAFVSVALQVAHFPMLLRAQPLLKSRRTGGPVCRRETAGVEAQFKSALP